MRPQSSLLDGRDSLRGTDDIAPRRSHAHPSLRHSRHSRLEAGQEQHAAAAPRRCAADNSTDLPAHALPSEAGPAQRAFGGPEAA